MRAMRLSLCLLLAAWLALPAAPQKKGAGAIVVYVTESGKKYHQVDCPHLRDSKSAKTLEEAIAAGYTACVRCEPPVPGKRQNPSDAESKRLSPQCQAVTKKGTRCKRKASEGSAYCWQHKKK
jgi:hypothetical protein